jgi:hypothetical protein
MENENIYTMTYEHNGEKFIKADMTLDACIATMEMNPRLNNCVMKKQGLRETAPQTADRQEK